MNSTHVYMCGGEPLKPDPFSLCLLKRSLDDLFSMVDVRVLHEKVLGRRYGKNVFGIFKMKYANFCVLKRIVTMILFIFGCK